MKLAFTLNIVPPKATAQGKGVAIINGKPRFFEKSAQRAASGFLAAMLSEHAPAQPFSQPLAVTVVWVFPWRKTERKLTRVLGLAWHGTKPDLDNLEKSLLDVMTRLGFWTDDSLIARKVTEKHRGDTPRLEITVEEL